MEWTFTFNGTFSSSNSILQFDVHWSTNLRAENSGKKGDAAGDRKESTDDFGPLLRVFNLRLSGVSCTL